MTFPQLPMEKKEPGEVRDAAELPGSQDVQLRLLGSELQTARSRNEAQAGRFMCKT